MPRNSVQDTTILYGLSKSRQSKIQWLNATVPVGAPGQFTEIDLNGFTVTFSGNRLKLTVSGGGGSGTVTSVALAMPGIFSVAGSPITTNGTFNVTLSNQSANMFWAGPSTGPAATPTFRFIANADLPIVDIAHGGTGASTALGARQNLDYEGAISFRLGRQDGTILLAGFKRTFILPSSYDNLTSGSWELYTFPGSTCSIDIQYIAFGTTDPTTANSIVGGVQPTTSGGQTATGVTSGWSPSSIARGGFISIQVLSNDLAREIRFFMPGRKI